MSAFFLAEEEFAGQMAPNCSRTSRRERRHTTAAGRHFEPTMYTSSPSPSEKRNFWPRCGVASPRARKVWSESIHPCKAGLEVKNQGSPPTHAPPRISLQGDCLLKGIGWFISSPLQSH